MLTDKDLESIEKKMLELARQKEEYCRIDVSKKEALEHFNALHETYKVELINDLEDGKITYYRQGSFTDLCRGPHLPDTSYIKAIKLTSLAGAYWRGNEHNKMLTRIYAGGVDCADGGSEAAGPSQNRQGDGVVYLFAVCGSRVADVVAEGSHVA